MTRWLSTAARGLLVCTVIAACTNAGEDRVLSVAATGILKGFVFFDGDGDRLFGGSADTRLQGVRLRLVARGTRDTTARATSDTGGLYRIVGVPVGSYVVVVDTTSLGDSAQVVRIDTSDVTVTPGDSIGIAIIVSFPLLSVAEARKQPFGRKVFVEGVALTQRTNVTPFGTFGDTTVFLADTSAGIRATRVKGGIILVGDSLRWLGAVSSRDGQSTLDAVTPFTLAIGGIAPLVQVGTAEAEVAGGGRLEAELVQVLGDSITDTATVAPDFRLTVMDSANGATLQVLLDKDAGFTGPALSPYVPGKRVDLTGVLVPVAPASWQLKPRGPADIVIK